MNTELSYCAALVREHDPDRFFITMMMPAHLREDLLALFAFYHEVAKTREVVRETQLGLIRLQWWREAIGKIYESGEILAHEVVQPLALAIERHGLGREHFEALIYAREFDLEDVLPSKLEGVVHYADYTSVPLFRLVMQVLGEDIDVEPVRPVAVNYALVGLLRAVPFHAMQKRCYLPEELMMKYGVRRLYDPPAHRYPAGQGMKPEGDFPGLVREVCGVFVPELKSSSRFLRVSQALAGMYLKQIRACGYNVFDPKMAREPGFKALRLYFS